MRRTHQVLSGIFFSLILTSCGDLSYNLSSSEQIWIPEEMYYQTDGTCENGDLVFKVLQASGIMLWTDPQNVLVGQSELYLNKNGTYDVRYREFTNTVDTAVFDTEFSGRYQVDSATGEISFENLGSGHVITRQGRYYLDFTYSVNINSTNLSGKRIRFRLTDALRGFNTDRSQYCNY
ncbi:hypothetical protein [Bdellovibrio sp. HCB-162]|uniref:hypothetical protein n=1 Tax=Bdellovibrio sp. HCB-162 TaxID=3394234 RepID=UPI0039BD6604